VTASAAAIPVATSSHARVVEQRSPAKKTPDRRAESPAISIPKATALAANFDSVVRARSGGARAEELSPGQLGLESGSGQRLTFERDDAANAPQRAQLIGSLPAPRYPAQLKDIEGEVRVRFQVDTEGRPVPSSISVVRSSDPLFTAATLKVIPGLRFEPARTGGLESKPVTDVVQIGFQFRPAK
jgi:TonB family protein